MAYIGIENLMVLKTNMPYSRCQHSVSDSTAQRLPASWSPELSKWAWLPARKGSPDQVTKHQPRLLGPSQLWIWQERTRKPLQGLQNPNPQELPGNVVHSHRLGHRPWARRALHAAREHAAALGCDTTAQPCDASCLQNFNGMFLLQITAHAKIPVLLHSSRFPFFLTH